MLEAGWCVHQIMQISALRTIASRITCHPFAGKSLEDLTITLAQEQDVVRITSMKMHIGPVMFTMHANVISSRLPREASMSQPNAPVISCHAID